MTALIDILRRAQDYLVRLHVDVVPAWGTLPTTMPPTALWSISRPCDRAMVGVTVVKISPTQIERAVMRALLHPLPACTEPPARSRATGLPEFGCAHLSPRLGACQ